MTKTLAVTTLTLCSLLGSAVVLADNYSATDGSHPAEFVKDSTITTEIKGKLASEHVASLGRIHVDTDKDGVVWLSGSARTQAEIDRAVAISKNTEHVRSVHSDIIIKADD
jgi:hyperosmotically inducible protein